MRLQSIIVWSLIAQLIIIPSAFSKEEIMTKECKKGEHEHAHYLYASIINSSHVIHDEALETEFNQMANQLARAAGIEKPDIEIVILSLPIAMAVSLPNEKILISSEMLNQIQNRDQAAFLLAHELTHIYYHDMQKLIDKRIGSEAAIMTIAVFGASFAGAFVAVAVGPTVSTLGTSASTSIWSNLAQRLATQAVYSSANWMKDEVYQVIEQGYSDETEFRADQEAVKLMRNMNYDLNAATDTVSIIKTSIADRYKVPEPVVETPRDDQETYIPAAEGRKLDEKNKKARDEKLKFMDERLERLDALIQQN